MRPLLVVVIVVFGIVTSGCAKRTLAAHSGWSFGTTTQASVPRSLKFGHLLESGSALILDVSLFDPGGWFTYDDESCNRVLVQIPLERLEQIPATVERPVAYYKRCSCTWGLCAEESASGGTVSVRARSASRVRGRLDLTFPSREFHLVGDFHYRQPVESVLSVATRR